MDWVPPLVCGFYSSLLNNKPHDLGKGVDAGFPKAGKGLLRHNGPAEQKKKKKKMLASAWCLPTIRQTCTSTQIYGNCLSLFLAAGLALSGLSHYLLFGLDKFAFAFLMRLSMSHRARRRCTLHSAGEEAAMGRWAGQKGHYCMRNPLRHHPRQKESWTILSEFTDKHTFFLSRCLLSPLAPNQKL